MTYNCECDHGQPTVTLADIRKRLARRLGFSVQVSMNVLPPGLAELLDDFTRSAHEQLYARYTSLRQERMFTWDLVAGQRFYDLDGNDTTDDCEKLLDPGKITWAGISQGTSSWQPLVCGIGPTLYGSADTGIPSHYEVRQCIELWPAPADSTWKLRIRGAFQANPLNSATEAHNVLTVDPEAVFLYALAAAKGHYNRADAIQAERMAVAYVRDRIKQSHGTRRYIPGRCEPPRSPPRPVLVGGYPED